VQPELGDIGAVAFSRPGDRRKATSERRKLHKASKHQGRRALSSAGVLMYRLLNSKLEFLLVHPGGPYWRKKDEGAWSIPKGEIDDGENAELAARREFLEVTGLALSRSLEPLGQAVGVFRFRV
jgi:8-oxo-dGTP pyrophosphatase MutT (NUDIX family)